MTAWHPAPGTLCARVLAHLEANRGQALTACMIAANVGASSRSVAMACFRLSAWGFVNSRPGRLRMYSYRVG